MIRHKSVPSIMGYTLIRNAINWSTNCTKQLDLIISMAHPSQKDVNDNFWENKKTIFMLVYYGKLQYFYNLSITI